MRSRCSIASTSGAVGKKDKQQRRARRREKREQRRREWEANRPLEVLRGEVHEGRVCVLRMMIAHPGHPHRHSEIDAIIDTGATASAINPQVAQALELPIVGTATASTAGGDGEVSVVAARMVIGDGEVKRTRVVPVSVCPMKDPMLFGMDLMAGGILKVDLVKRTWEWRLMPPKKGSK